jgi:MoxR-vWA-beta-propeller ternary system domain bpX4
MSTLNQFLSDLWKNGQVEVAHELKAFSAEELNEALLVLQKSYRADQIHLPGTVPTFAAEPALWAAQYLYRAIQFILLRHLDEKTMQEHLLPWPAEVNAEAVYAADLSLRHLPNLFSFAKGLSPADPLLLELKKTASNWPFSGLGIAEAAPEAESLLLSHPALAIAYTDRIIAKRLKAKAQEPHIRPLIAAALGDHAHTLWPNWDA